MKRRDFLIVTGASLLGAGCAPLIDRYRPFEESTPPLIETRNARGTAMYGLIGKFTAAEGGRDALAKILVDGVAGMPGCLSYVVATDPADETTLWITEVWDSRESHQASLQLPSVQEAISKGRPLIAGMERVAETTPVGGHGL